jgi:4'-phosphopantetheinyl transferase
MNRIYWLCQSHQDLPADNHWMAVVEREQFSEFRFEKRRADWQLGRWTAKRSIAAYLGIDALDATLASIEIANNADGAPQANYSGAWDGCAVSLSHSHGVALCAVAAPTFALGCDLELVEPRGPGFLADYFTSREKSMVEATDRDQQAWLITALWSAKESALKVLGTGLRRDTRDVEICSMVRNSSRGWLPLSVLVTPEDRRLQGWWCRRNNHLLTLVAHPAPGVPEKLRAGALR